jgi:hypothetical protein
LKKELLDQDPEVITGLFYDKKGTIESSRIFEALNEMPKPACHHLHFTAACPLRYLIKLTYRDHVYYNQKANELKVTKDPSWSEEGYVKCNSLRQYWSSPSDFDKYLEEKIILGPDQIASKETRQIWGDFQYKFSMCLSIYNYYEFFEYILGKVIRSFISQHVVIIEIRHIFKCVFDDKFEIIGIEREMEIFDRVVSQIKQEVPQL